MDDSAAEKMVEDDSSAGADFSNPGGHDVSSGGPAPAAQLSSGAAPKNAMTTGVIASVVVLPGRKSKVPASILNKQIITVSTPKDLGSAYGPISEFFHKRFVEQCKAAGGTESVLTPWKVLLLRASGGVTTAGTLEVNYESPKHRVFPNAVMAMMSLNLTPNARSSKGMSRPQHALVALESLEKSIISHMMATTGGRADAIRMDAIDSTRITVTVRSEEDQKAFWEAERRHAASSAVVPSAADIFALEAVLTHPRPAATVEFTSGDSNSRFSFGTCTVLSWGTIVPEVKAFHTAMQIYPIGFRCVRLEHDVMLNRAVECICEILCINATGEEDSISSTYVASATPKVPLFRVTVGWQVGPEGGRKLMPKTYQARTQQEAWVAAMSERCGLTDDAAPAQAGEDSAARESKEAAKDRRDYYSALKIASDKVDSKTRLGLDPKESLTILEEGIMRLIEGLSGAVDCANYEFIGAREHDGGKKYIQRAYARALEKAMRLSRVAQGNHDAKTKAKRGAKRDLTGNVVSAGAGAGLALGDESATAGDFSLSEDAEMLLVSGGLASKFKPKVIRGTKAVKDKDVLPPLPPPIGTGYNASMEYGEGNPYAFASGMTAERRARSRDVERLIRVNKDMFHARVIKKRISDAKDRIKLRCDEEEKAYMAINNLGSAGRAGNDAHVRERGVRPDPLHGMVKLHGSAFTQVIELWEFLTTYHRVFNLQQIPTIEILVSALKQCDPGFNVLQNKSVFPATPARSATSLSGEPYEQESHSLDQQEATELLNKIGMLFAELLKPDYERIMGIDIAGGSIGGLNIPVNLLTWREVARTVLIHGITRECGYSEMDALCFIKGKGFVYAPDAGDKKILKLIRKRINWQRSISLDYQESVVGFSSGIVVRMPTPSTLKLDVGLQWRELVLRLIHVEPTCAWLVYETIESAHNAVDGTDWKQVHAVKRCLVSCLQPGMMHTQDATRAKLTALKSLETRTGHSGSSESAARESRSLDILRSYFSECAKLAEADPSVGPAPALKNIPLDTVYTSSATFPWDPARYNNKLQQRLGLALATPAAVVTDPEVKGGEASADTDAMADGAADDSSQTYFNRGGNFGGHDDDDEEEGEDNENSALKKQQPWRFSEDYAYELDARDAEAYDRLPTGACRCLDVLKSLMRNPALAAFNWPIDSLTTPQYYAHVPQPLCFYDVRRHLLTGGYNDNITGFYCDMAIILENALSYNPENSLLSLLTQRTVILFERLFFEQVLCWEYPLPQSDCCHICRHAEPVDPTRCVTCDRCEALFHLQCVNPALTRVPKGDWLCSFCVEQRSISETHPNKIAVVLHPQNPNLTGHVLAIDQDHKHLRFIVFFPEKQLREVWDGTKVRRYTQAYHDKCKQDIFRRDGLTEKDYSAALPTCSAAEAAKGYSIHKKFIARPNSEPANPLASLSELKECLADWMPTMPSGYNIDDFDMVCGLARGYTGLYQTHYAVPCHIHDSHNIKARHRAVADPYFDRSRRAIAALTSSQEPHHPGAMEWLAVLRTLMQRVIHSAAITEVTTELEEELSGAMESGMKVIREGKVCKATLIRTCEVKQGNTIEQIPDEEAVVGENKEGGDIAFTLANCYMDDMLNDAWNEDACRASLAQVQSAENSSAKETSEGKSAADLQSVGESVPPSTEFTAHHVIALIRKRMQGSNKSERLTDADARQILWELRRLSRYRARDDALLAHGIMADLMNSIDLDCVRDVRPEEAALLVPSLSAVSAGSSSSAGPSVAVSASANAMDVAAPGENGGFGLNADAAASTGADAGKPSQKLVSLYNLVAGILLRQCMPKIVDAVDLEEWTEWWDASMVQQSLVCLDVLEKRGVKPLMPPNLYSPAESEPENVKTERHSAYERKCAFCKQREPYLASHFVYGQTWDEWAAECNAAAAAVASAVHTGAAVKQENSADTEEKGRGAASSASSSSSSSSSGLTIGDYKLLVTSMQGTAAASIALLEPFLETARKQMQWLVADAALLNKEQSDVREKATDTLHYQEFPPCQGSVIVHEVCMEHMRLCRETALPRTLRRDETTMLDIFVGIGRGKSKPIGCDRLGGRYWIFSGSPYLYVSSPPPHLTTDYLIGSIFSEGSKDKQGNIVRSATLHDMSNMDIPSTSASEHFKKQYFVSAGYDPEGAADGSGGLTWVVYRDEWDISRLIRWLDVEHELERQVSKSLRCLFPAAAKLAATDDSPSPAAREHHAEASPTFLHSQDIPGYMPSDVEYISDSSDGESGDEVIEPTSEDERKPQIRSTDPEDTESEGEGVHAITSRRRAARKATKAIHGIAQEEAPPRVRAYVRRQRDDDDDETDSDVEYSSSKMADSAALGDYENGVGPKPVRVLHPDDEPKKRGRPQVQVRTYERFIAPVQKEGRFIGTVLPQGPQLEYVSIRLLDGAGSARFPNAPKTFDLGARVFVQNPANGILWEAVIIGRHEEQRVSYKVRFDRWGANYDQWVSPQHIAAPTDRARIGRKYRKARSIMSKSQAQYSENEHWALPEPIRQLRAAAVLEDMDMQGISRLPISFSDARADNPIGMLRAAMFVIDAALPEASKDENEEKWGKGTSFTRCWRESVAQAKDATDLMCALLMFEFSIRQSWIKPTGLKLMACLPSRNIVSRRASLGLVATRLWALDAAIRYEKNISVEDSGKNAAEKLVRKERHAYHGRAPPPVLVKSAGSSSSSSSSPRVGMNVDSGENMDDNESVQAPEEEE